MKDNRGFSLLELLAVVAIMAILMGGFITMWGIVPKAKCNRCADSLKKAVEGGRTDAISFFNCSVTIERRSDGVYATKVTQRGIHAEDGTGSMADTSEEKQIGKSGVVISYTFDNSLAEDSFVELEESHTLEINYKRSTGSFDLPKIDGVEQSQYLTGIKVQCGAFEKVLRLTQLTGNTELL